MPKSRNRTGTALRFHRDLHHDLRRAHDEWRFLSGSRMSASQRLPFPSILSRRRHGQGAEQDFFPDALEVKQDDRAMDMGSGVDSPCNQLVWRGRNSQKPRSSIHQLAVEIQTIPQVNFNSQLMDSVARCRTHFLSTKSTLTFHLIVDCIIAFPI